MSEFVRIEWTRTPVATLVKSDQADNRIHHAIPKPGDIVKLRHLSVAMIESMRWRSK